MAQARGDAHRDPDDASSLRVLASVKTPQAERGRGHPDKRNHDEDEFAVDQKADPESDTQGQQEAGGPALFGNWLHLISSIAWGRSLGSLPAMRRAYGLLRGQQPHGDSASVRCDRARALMR
jgi:hypothetical protein